MPICSTMLSNDSVWKKLEQIKIDQKAALNSKIY